MQEKVGVLHLNLILLYREIVAAGRRFFNIRMVCEARHLLYMESHYEEKKDQSFIRNRRSGGSRGRHDEK